MAHKKRCEDVIENKLAARIAELLPQTDDEYRAAYEFATGCEMPEGDTPEEQWQEFGTDAVRESVLGVSKQVRYKVLLSTGGPADGFYLDYDPHNRCFTGGQYFYQDWFDGATRDISAEQAESLADLFCCGPEFE